MKVTEIFRYPAKGLSGESLSRVLLKADEGIQGDRAIALTREPGLFDPAAPVALWKMNFLMLAKDEDLAKLSTRFDPSSQRLEISLDGEIVLKASVSTEVGKNKISAFFKKFLSKEELNPELTKAPGHKFTDISKLSPKKMQAISLINLASIHALEKATGRTIDRRRFRANIYFDSKTPFIEHDWINQNLRIGEATLRCVMQTRRCPATEVNPETGERDIKVPFELNRHFGHYNMGIYAEVITTGEVKISDGIDIDIIRS